MPDPIAFLASIAAQHEPPLWLDLSLIGIAMIVMLRSARRVADG